LIVIGKSQKLPDWGVFAIKYGVCKIKGLELREINLGSSKFGSGKV